MEMEFGEEIGEPMVREWEGEPLVFDSVTYSPDGKWLVSNCRENFLQRWNAITGRAVGDPIFIGDECYRARTVLYSPDGDLIIAGTSDGKFHRWDARTGKRIGEPIQGHDTGINTIVYVKKLDQFISDSTDGVIRFWNPKNFGLLGETLPQSREFSFGRTAYSPTLRDCVSSTSVATLVRRDLRNGAILNEAPLDCYKKKNRIIHFEHMNRIVHSPEGLEVVTISTNSGIQRWNALTLKPIGEKIEKDRGSFDYVNYSPDGKVVLAIDCYGLLFYNAETWDRWVILMDDEKPAGWVSGAFSPDDRAFATVCEDGVIRRWASRHFANPLDISNPYEKPVTREVGFAL